MKLALIPPIPNLYDFTPTGYNLVLAHLLDKEEYQKYYRSRAALGDFNILDNGAHEGKQYSFEDLLLQSTFIGAKEVVIQDVPHDAEATLYNFHAALSWLSTANGKRMYEQNGSPRLMFVPQVPKDPANLHAYVALTREMISACFGTWIQPWKFTIGIALMYECIAGGLVEVAERVATIIEDTGIAVHLLGWSRNMMSPITIGRRFPSLVRSVDTAKPFVYAQEDQFLRIDSHGELIYLTYPTRSPNYFFHKLDARSVFIGNYNARVLEALLFDPFMRNLPKSATDLSKADRQQILGHRP